MVLRKFSPELEKLATLWFDNPESTVKWTETGIGFGGEAASFQVKSDTGWLAMAKPGRGRDDPGNRKALEKIASDIGKLLELPVPPVSLYEFDRGSAKAHLTSLSAWAFPTCVTLAMARNIGFVKPGDEDYLNEVASAGYVYDLFLGNKDRHPGNVVVSRADDDTLTIALIDHAYTMTYEWQDAQWPWQSVNFFGVKKVSGVMKDMAKSISLLQDAQLYDLIQRLNKELLSPERSELILKNLCYRKQMITDIIEKEFREAANA